MTSDEELRQNAALREEVTQFLNQEAKLLDDQELHDWLDLITDDIEYRVPVRVTRERGAEQSEFSEKANIFKEDQLSLDARVRRFDKEYAWSENPPTRTRRFVSNILLGEGGADIPDNEVAVRSNVFVYRAKEDEVDPNFICGQRIDRLRRVDGELKLASRTVELDHTVLDTRPLSIFL